MALVLISPFSVVLSPFPGMAKGERGLGSAHRAPCSAWATATGEQDFLHGIGSFGGRQSDEERGRRHRRRRVICTKTQEAAAHESC